MFMLVPVSATLPATPRPKGTRIIFQCSSLLATRALQAWGSRMACCTLSTAAAATFQFSSLKAMRVLHNGAGFMQHAVTPSRAVLTDVLEAGLRFVQQATAGL